MLSPAKYHLDVPKELVANLEYRQRLLVAARAEGPAGAAAVWRMCKDDLLFFVNVFVFQINPKEKQNAKVGPFITYEFQDRALLRMLFWIEDGRDGVIEKSRQMGASWMMVILFVWLWLFHDWQSLHFISRNADMVDSDKDESLYFKIDFILKLLPDWLLPDDWIKKRSDMLYQNFDLESSISGEASTGKAGVGGNKTAMGIDEYSQIEDDYSVLHRTSNTTNCRIFNGTHLGTETAFFELTERVDMEKLVLHWTEHPVYNRGMYRFDPEAPTPDKIIRLDPTYDYPLDYPFVKDGLPTGGPRPGVRSPWYDEQARKKGSARAMAMDVDIDPRGAVSQFFDAFMIQRLRGKDAMPPLWEGDLIFDRDTGMPVFLERRRGGPLRLWLTMGLDQMPPRGRYTIGGDVSWGRGATPSCLSVMRWVNGAAVQVGEYESAFIQPDAFGALSVALARCFRNSEGGGAKLGWETSGPGGPYRDAILALGYRNVYYRVDDKKDPPERSEMPGWYSSPTNKANLLEGMLVALRQGKCQMRSDRALAEFLEFRHDGRGGVEHPRQKTLVRGKAGPDPSGAGEAHADLAMAAALAKMLADEYEEEATTEPEEEPDPRTFAGRLALAAREKTTIREQWS